MNYRRLKFFIFYFLIATLPAAGQSWQWSETAGSVQADYGNKIKFDHQGNMIIHGYSSANSNFAGINFNYVGNFVAKYDSDKVLQWIIPAGDKINLSSINRQTSGSIEVDHLGNTFVTGTFSDTCIIGSDTLAGNTSPYNAFLAKLDPFGNVVWTKYVTDQSQVTSIALDSSGNVIVCGYTEGISTFDGVVIDPYGTSNRDIIFAKYNNSGIFQWVRRCGGSGFYADRGFSIACDAQDNIIIGGHIRSDADFGGLTLLALAPFESYFNGFIAKYSGAGNAMWVNYCGSACVALTVLSNDEIIAAGYHGIGNGYDSVLTSAANGMFVAKLDAAGNYIWARSNGGSGTCGISDISSDAEDYIYVAGHFNGNISIGSDTLIGNSGGSVWYTHMFTAKYNSNGVEQWSDQAGGGIGSHTWGFGIASRACDYAVIGSFQAPPAVIHEDTLSSFGNYDLFFSYYNNALINSSISATTSKSNASCNGVSNGSAKVVPNGGTTPYSYVWNTVPSQTTDQITGISGGIYTCNISDKNKCNKKIDVNIFEPTSLQVFSILNNPAPGDINLLVTGGVAPYRFNWNTGSTNEDLTNVSPGFYFCQVSDRNGCANIHTVTLLHPGNH